MRIFHWLLLTTAQPYHGLFLQVRQLLKLQEQFEISEAARQAQHVGNAGVIADLTATNHQLQGQVTSLTRQLEEAQIKRHHAEESKASQQAQRAAADATNTEAIANLTHVNGQLMKQISELGTQLDRAQMDATSAKHAQQADAESRLSHEDSTQLQEQIHSLTQQLSQAQQELQKQDDSSAQHAQQDASISSSHAVTQTEGALIEQTTNLSKKLEQSQHDLYHVQDSSAAQHAQQAADSSEDITDLTTANSRLLEQVAESQGKIVQAQRQAEAATKQLQHMRELVKAQHAKREEHATSLQAQLDSLQQECQGKHEQVRNHFVTCCMCSLLTICSSSISRFRLHGIDNNTRNIIRFARSYQECLGSIHAA